MAEDVNVEFLINEIGGKRRGSGFVDENIIQTNVNNINSQFSGIPILGNNMNFIQRDTNEQ